MNTSHLETAAAFLACATPFLIGPVVVGLLILLRYRRDLVTLSAGLFTLKPVAATMIYAVVLASSLVTVDENHIDLVSFIVFLAPSLGLTIALVAGFRSLLFKSRIFRILLGLDLGRWLIGLLLHPLWVTRPGGTFLCDSILQLVPTAYALVALALVREYVAFRKGAPSRNARA